MSREDEWDSRVEEPGVGFRGRDPLQVEEIAVGEPEPGERERMLERLRDEASVA